MGDSTTGLRDLHPLPEDLSSDEVNIAEAFYCPCLRRSSHYARISGFFSSLVYLIAWPALRDFLLKNDGEMQIVCSPRISAQDASQIRQGYRARSSEELASTLNSELQNLLEQPELRNPTRLLGCLVAEERISVKFAEVEDSAPPKIRRMFHDKVGVFTDSSGDRIGFRGSLNETFLGLSPDLGHIESIDVWPSWVGGRDARRVENAVRRFNRIWEGESDRIGIRLSDLPPTVHQNLVELGQEVDLKTALDDLKEPGTRLKEPSGSSISLRPHQAEALEKWEDANWQGILAHATGSGKTVTGVFGIKSLADRGLSAVIIVPSGEIQDQWYDEIEGILGVRAVRCGGGHSTWSSRRLVRAAVTSSDLEVVIAVLGTARKQKFITQLQPGLEQCLVIIDEVHRVGADDSSRILSDTEPAYRLGLSATPRRAGDPEGTKKIFDYFGGIVHTYSLADAIRDGYLTPYRYTVHAVHLTDDEQETWDRWTKRISKLSAWRVNNPDDSRARDKLKVALRERAKIKKGASQKASKAITVATESYERGDRILVYCDNREQLQEVLAGLLDKGVPAREYHSKMTGDRAQTLEWLQGRGGILVSMKCLDEGVDIPRANKGLILASSTNEREFIQRRGRLLRKGGEHPIADLADLIVLPADRTSESRTKGLLGPELARAMLFARDSLSLQTVSVLEDLWSDYGLPLSELEELAREGIEMDENGP